MSKRRDRRMMGRALALADLNRGLTGPNPSVGCVVTDRAGRVLGEAVTGVGGRPHAEEQVLDALGDAAKGGTAYVTLEPCSQRSSGAPSCSERFVSAGIARVVVAIRDPHPQGSGGIKRMREAGIDVFLGLKSDQARNAISDWLATI